MSKLNLHDVLDILAKTKPEFRDFKTKGVERTYRCVFHNDRTPSLHVKQDCFHCFGCGKQGSATDFLAKYWEIPNSQAYSKGCELLGHTYKKENEERDMDTTAKSIPLKILKKCQPLNELNDYLRSRGLTSLHVKDTLFEAPNNININDKEGNRIYVAQGSLVVPIKDAQGVVKTLQYISPDNQKFLLKNHPLKNHFLELKVDPKASTFMVEGVIDGITLNEVGFNAVVCFNAQNLEHIALNHNRKFFNKAFVFADNDEVGLQAGEYASRILGTGCLYVKSVQNPQTEQFIKDANDAFQAFGKEKLKQKINNFLQREQLKKKVLQEIDKGIFGKKRGFEK